MKKQIITLVSLIILSTQAFALGSPCTGKNVAGRWNGQSLFEQEEVANCGWQKNETNTFFLLFGNGKGNGSEKSIMTYEKEICGSDVSTSEIRIQLLEAKSIFSVTYTDSGSTYEQECRMLDANTMEVNGVVFKRQK